MDLVWLPKQLPENVRLIVSALEGRALTALRANSLPEIIVGPLPKIACKGIVAHLLNTTNKQLNETQVKGTCVSRKGDHF